MYIKSLIISGFRCFDKETEITLSNKSITTFLGSNASGKTAILQALEKIFGITASKRAIQYSDFHFRKDENPENRENKNLFIEVILAFPEIESNSEAENESIPAAFKHMILENVGTTPICRMRLEAEWEDDGTAEGTVSQKLFWITCTDKEIDKTKKSPVSATERGLIQVHYTPASRDAATVLRTATREISNRLLRIVEWTEATKENLKKTTEILSETFQQETAISEIGKILKEHWSELHDEDTDINPRLNLISHRLEEIIKTINVIFEQGGDGLEHGIERLSDGQQSLFYFALTATLFELERKITTEEIKGFQKGKTNLPILTIFALEEPENHLSPYFLSRIIGQVQTLTRNHNAQAIMTSHSPSALTRIEADQIRYCRQDQKNRISNIKTIKLPDKNDEAAKFIRNALLAYPELYFARFVLLVEGDSESVVLPRLASALKLPIDPAFVAIVPLGGRHVNHFWNLLEQLQIPYATLLDLDLGRCGGGYGRIKTVLENLIKIGKPKDEVLPNKDCDLSQMHTWDNALYLDGWINWCKKYGVYFSEPLDLDLMMLKAFPKAYHGSPRTTEEDAIQTVLGKSGSPDIYQTDKWKDYPALFPDYLYHFKTHSKPATHLQALASLSDEDIQQNIPPLYKELLEHIKSQLSKGLED